MKGTCTQAGTQWSRSVTLNQGYFQLLGGMQNANYISLL